MQAAGHTGKYLGLGNKSGLGGTHRHSLEKLKEYESQLLMSSTNAGNAPGGLEGGSGARATAPSVITSTVKNNDGAPITTTGVATNAKQGTD